MDAGHKFKTARKTYLFLNDAYGLVSIECYEQMQ